MSPETKITVLMGGPGSERQVSIASGTAVLKALQSLGLDATGLELTGTTLDLPPGTGLAYNLIHGTFGEDGQLQELLEQQGIPYTGARSASSRIAFDKNLAKARFIAAGVPTPRSEILDLSEGPKVPTIPVPFVVKPPREGSSVGVTIVRDPAQAAAAIAEAAKFSNDLLIEEFIEGKELTVAILDDADVLVDETERRALIGGLVALRQHFDQVLVIAATSPEATRAAKAPRGEFASLVGVWRVLDGRVERVVETPVPAATAA